MVLSGERETGGMMKDTFKAKAQAQLALSEACDKRDRWEAKADAAPTACNALMCMYARDEVAIRQTMFDVACKEHEEALKMAAAEMEEMEERNGYISFGPVCNEDGSPTEFTKQFFGID
jgi:hypothetical protein